jgi:hypothetical protein
MNTVQTVNTVLNESEEYNDLSEYKDHNRPRLSERDKQVVNLYIRSKNRMGMLSNDFSDASKAINNKIGDYLCCMNRLTKLLEIAIVSKNIATYETFLISRKEYLTESEYLKEINKDIARLRNDLIKSLDSLIHFSNNYIIEEFINKNIAFDASKQISD